MYDNDHLDEQWLRQTPPPRRRGAGCGLTLLLVLLLTGVVRVDHIREKSDFLLGNLGFFFIPVSVSIMNYVDLLWQHAAAFLTVCAVSMVLTYGATVWAVRLTQRLMDRGGKRK